MFGDQNICVNIVILLKTLSFGYVPLVLSPQASAVCLFPLGAGNAGELCSFHVSTVRKRLMFLASELELHHLSIEDEPETKLLS